MAEQLTHESVVAPSSDLAPLSDIDEEYRDQVAAVLQKRADVKPSGGVDAIIAVEEWAYADWSDYDITGGPFLLVEHVEDYSEDAYLLDGAFEIVMGEIEGRTAADVDDGSINEQLQQVDETDGEYHDEKGEMYLPKSAVEAIHVKA